MTVFQAKDGLRFICLGMPMNLHDRAGKLASLLYKVEKPSVRTFLAIWISAVAAWIDVRLAPRDSYVFWHDEVYFYKFLRALVFQHKCAIDTCVDPDSH